ncbi:hypothetical protein Bca4012_084692 [Brassica carinata]
MLEIMFNEPQLLLVFRVALEIEMIYGLQNNSDDTEEAREYHPMTGDDIISLEGDLSLSPDPPNNFVPNDEVLHGEPITIDDIPNTLPNLEAATMVHQEATFRVEPVNLWEDLPNEEAYWEGMIEEGRTYEVFIPPFPNPIDGVIGVPLAQNRRVCAPQPPTIIVIDDDDQASYTGSSQGLNDTDNTITFPPSQAEGPDSTVDANSGQAGLTVEPVAEAEINSNGKNETSNHAIIPTPTGTAGEPFLDLTLAVGIANNMTQPDPLINNEDLSSEAEDGCGVFRPLF